MLFRDLDFCINRVAGADLESILADFLNEGRKRKFLGRRVPGGMLSGEKFWILSLQSPLSGGVFEPFRQDKSWIFTDCPNHFLDFNLESLLLLLLLKIY